jgi:transposase InsO family protein
VGADVRSFAVSPDGSQIIGAAVQGGAIFVFDVGTHAATRALTNIGNTALAEKLIRETCERQGIAPSELTLHADRGPAMTSKPVALLLSESRTTTRSPRHSSRR